MDERAGFVAKGIAVGRVLYGIGCMAAPRQMMGPAGGRAEGTMVAMIRAFGVRDLVLGAGTFMALADDPAEGLRWVQVSALADSLDVANAVVFGKELDKLAVTATLALAVPASVGGWWAARGLRRA